MAALQDVTVEQVTTLEELVDLAGDLERSISSLQAARDGVLTLAARWALSAAGDADEADISLRTVSAELATALRVSDRTVQRRMLAAELAVEQFPLVWQAQGAGQISAGHARVIIDAGEHIEDADARAAYSERVLELAQDESPNRVRPLAERIAQQHQPRSIEERHQDAREERGAWVQDHPDAMGEMRLFGPAALIHGAFDRLTGMAKTGSKVDGASSPSDQRTVAQKRFDIAMDLLLTGAPAGHDTEDGLLAAVTAHISVTVPALTLMGRERAGGAQSPPAELDGHGPIDPDTARQLAGAASGWDRLLTHPFTGALLATDRYRPGEKLRRQLRARDQRCRFPTCRMPVRESDLDHTLDAAFGGSTEEGNLGALCRRHHTLKHHSPWHVVQLDDGLLEWTSPTGHTYVDRPPPQNTVTFADTSANVTVAPF